MANSKPTKEELRAEVERLRAEVATAVDQVTERMSPAYQTARIKDAGAQTLTDAKTLLTGGGMPAAEDGDRARNVKIALGAAGAFAAIVALKILKRARR